MPKTQSKPKVIPNIAQVVYDSYPDSDLLPMDRPGPKVWPPDAGQDSDDTLFQFIMNEMADARSDPRLDVDTQIGRMERAIADIQAVIAGIRKAAAEL